MNDYNLTPKLLDRIAREHLRGTPPDVIKHDMEKEGIPQALTQTLIEAIDAEIDKARRSHNLKSFGAKIGLHFCCVLVLCLCWIAGMGWEAIQPERGNLIPLNIFGINVVDSIVATVLVSLALTSIATFFYMFKIYFQ
ncbi:MAG: hypothetical protein CMO55_05620 [Verrucomicrobiales bacterium]|nr:hypothetical protein [Verrucomicrobiales bacterium]